MIEAQAGCLSDCIALCFLHVAVPHGIAGVSSNKNILPNGYCKNIGNIDKKCVYLGRICVCFVRFSLSLSPEMKVWIDLSSLQPPKKMLKHDYYSRFQRFIAVCSFPSPCISCYLFFLTWSL